MAKLTKKDLEARVAELEARVAEQSAMIAKLIAAPAAPPLLLAPCGPAPCLRPHADEVRSPYIPYVPQPYPPPGIYPVWEPVHPFPVDHEIICMDHQPTINFGPVQNMANACCAAPMLGTVWVGPTNPTLDFSFESFGGSATAPRVTS
jgi:hypothetical protein